MNIDHDKPLSPEEREAILSQLHQRKLLEEKALKEQAAAQRAEAERYFRETQAAEHRKREQERRQYISQLLDQSLDEFHRAIAAFSENDESACYRLLVKFDSNLNLAKQKLTVKPLLSEASGSLPTIRIVADNNPNGWMIINLEDFNPAIHQQFEEDN